MTTEPQHLTDNAWTARVDYLRQAIADLPDAPDSPEAVEYYLTDPDFFGGTDFDDADRTVLRREMQRQYGVN